MLEKLAATAWNASVRYKTWKYAFYRRQQSLDDVWNSRYTFNYSIILCYRINAIVLIAVVLTFPSYMRKLPIRSIMKIVFEPHWMILKKTRMLQKQKSWFTYKIDQ
jgi:hypothetical protein